MRNPQVTSACSKSIEQRNRVLSSDRNLPLEIIKEDIPMSERINLQDQFLNTLCKEHMHCSVFLVNGIKLVGKIESFDQYMVLLRGNDQAVQAIFKHAISTISPAKQVSLGARESEPPAT